MSFFSSLGSIATGALSGFAGSGGNPLGALIGGATAAFGSHNAGNSARAGANQGSALDQARFDQIRGMQQPWMSAGQGAQGSLDQYLGIGGNKGAAGYGSLMTPYHFGQSAPGQFNYTGQQAPGAFNPTPYKQFTLNDFYNNSPAYKFQKEQGMQGVLNGASAGSGAMSGAAQKDLMGYNQGLANTAWGNAFNQNMQGQQQRYQQQLGQYEGQLQGYNSQFGNQLSGYGANMGRYLDMNNQNFGQYNTQQGNIYNRLMGVSQLGQGATNQVANTGANLGMDQAQGYSNAGAAAAWGQTGMTNAMAGTAMQMPWDKMIAGAQGAMNGGGGELPTDSNPWQISSEVPS